MYDVHCRLHRGEVEEQERTIMTQGAFPQETPPSLLPPIRSCRWSHFPTPGLRNNQLLLFYIVVFLFFFLFLLLFRRDIFFWCWSCFLFSVAAALHSAFCCRGWVFLGVEEKTRGRGLGAPPGRWFPNRSWEDCIDIRMRKFSLSQN